MRNLYNKITYLILNTFCVVSLLSAKTSPNDLASTGYAQLESGDYTTAIKTFGEILKKDASNLEALLGEAIIYTKQQDYAAALIAYDKIIKITPNNAFAWNGRGLAAYNLHNFDSALDSFKRATEQQPSGFFYESLAWTRMCRGEYSLAAESAKLALLQYNSAGEHSLYPLLIAYFAYLESSEKLNANRTLAYALSNSRDRNWPQPVIAYLAGKIDAAEMISYVTSLSEETEAHTYIGLKLKISGALNTAKLHFDWVIQSGHSSVFEHTLVRSISMRKSFANNLF